MSTLEFTNALLELEGHLNSFAMTFTKSSDDAKDLTQETFLKAITYKKQYKPKTNFKAWTFTIMRNIFINQYRRKVKYNSIFDLSKDFYLINHQGTSYCTPSQIMFKKEILKHVNKLSTDYQVPFILHIEGYKYKEIAKNLNIPIGTVKSRIFIARKKLIESLPEYTFPYN